MLPAGVSVCPRDGSRGVADNPFGEEATMRHSKGTPRASNGGRAPAPPIEVLEGAPAEGSEDLEEVDENRWEETVSRDVLVGKRIGDFIVKRRIGAGGMGIVYEGEHPIIGRKVAIKILRPDFSEGARARDLVAEARAASAIRHRGIIDVFGFGTIPHLGQYLVMEYLDGAPLDEIIAQRAPMLEGEVIPLLDELLAALAAAHAMGVIHRDLKPGNIFVVRDSSGGESVKVLDFGLAKRSEVPHGSTPQTRASLIVGTPEYMAPEQASGHAVGPHTDLYAVGVIAFEMLTRKLPFEGPTGMAIAIQHVQSPPPAPSTYVDLHPALDALVLRLLAKPPSQRPASAEAVRRELKTIARQLADGATRLSPPPHGDNPTEELPSVRAEHLSQPTPVVVPGAPAPRNSRPVVDSITTTRPGPPTTQDGPISRTRVAPTTTEEQTVLPTRAAPTTEELAVRPTRVEVPTIDDAAAVRPSRLPLFATLAVLLLLGLGGLGYWTTRKPSDPVDVPPPGSDPTNPLQVQAPDTPTPPPPSPPAEVKPENPPPSEPTVAAAQNPSETAKPTTPSPSAEQLANPDAQKPKPGERTGNPVATRPNTSKALEPGTKRVGKLNLIVKGWAHIYVNNEELGRVPPLSEVELPAGRHNLMLVPHPTLKPYRKVITIKAGETLELPVTFEPAN
jgi:serine/threonine-protein kinase